MAIVFQLEDGDAGSSDFSDATKKNIVSTAFTHWGGESSPPKHFGAGAHVGKTSQAFVGSELVATRPFRKKTSFLTIETAAQSNAAAGTQTGNRGNVFTKDGVDFGLTSFAYTHAYAASALSAETANAIIPSVMGTGWEIADWNDFASFSEDDFKGFLRIIAPYKSDGHLLIMGENNCSRLLEITGTPQYESIAFGWVLLGGAGSVSTNKYVGGGAVAGQETVTKQYMWSFQNGHTIKYQDTAGQYLNNFVVLQRGEKGTMPYLCKRTSSPFPNTKGGCF